jgi:putative hydrolase of the HAD superfamily
MPAIEAVIFDWGGTLSQWADQDVVDTLWRPAAEVLATDALAPDRADAIHQALLDAEGATWQTLRGGQESARLNDIVAAAAISAGLTNVDHLHAPAAQAYLDAWSPLITHHPDALPVLAACKSIGLKTGLLSNTHWPAEFHNSLLARDGLLEYFDTCVYTCDLSHMKPHPIAFRSVLRALDVAPGKTVFVGDRLHDDIFGAQQSGMRAVYATHGMEDDFDVTPDAVIHSLTELVPVLDTWLNLG